MNCNLQKVEINTRLEGIALLRYPATRMSLGMFVLMLREVLETGSGIQIRSEIKNGKK